MAVVIQILLSVFNYVNRQHKLDRKLANFKVALWMDGEDILLPDGTPKKAEF